MYTNLHDFKMFFINTVSTIFPSARSDSCEAV